MTDYGPVYRYDLLLATVFMVFIYIMLLELLADLRGQLLIHRQFADDRIFT